MAAAYCFEAVCRAAPTLDICAFLGAAAIHAGPDLQGCGLALARIPAKMETRVLETERMKQFRGESRRHSKQQQRVMSTVLANMLFPFIERALYAWRVFGRRLQDYQFPVRRIDCAYQVNIGVVVPSWLSYAARLALWIALLNEVTQQFFSHALRSHAQAFAHQMPQPLAAVAG